MPSCASASNISSLSAISGTKQYVPGMSKVIIPNLHSSYVSLSNISSLAAVSTNQPNFSVLPVMQASFKNIVIPAVISKKFPVVPMS